MNLKTLSFLVVIVAVAAAYYRLFISTVPVGFENTKSHIIIKDSNITYARDENGILHFWVKDMIEFSRASGFAHARDRTFQLFFLRVIAQGRLSEVMASNDETNKVDIFMKQRGFLEDAKLSYERDIKGTKEGELLKEYAAGVNMYLKSDDFTSPLEFVLTQYKPEEWEPEHSLMIVKLMSYIGLAESQEHMEKFILQNIQHNVDSNFLKYLLTPFGADNYDQFLNNKTWIDLVKKVNIEAPYIPTLLLEISTSMASNNWAVDATLSATGSSILATDPHLDIARLPSIWQELVFHFTESIKGEKDWYISGIACPGFPGIIMGRNKNIAFGQTYGFMDMIDFFIEDCNDELQCKNHEGKYVNVEKVVHKIQRKNSSPLSLTIYRTENGVIELNPNNTLKKGYYLSRGLSSFGISGKGMSTFVQQMILASTLEEAIDAASQGEISFNHILASREGKIAYVQSGVMPDRSVKDRSGGSLFALPGWEKDNLWKGIIPYSKYHRETGERFLSTANNFQPFGVNLHMGPYRKDRISQMLQEAIEKTNGKVTTDDLKRIQRDLYSLQAERYFTNGLKSVLDNSKVKSPVIEILRDWDFGYNKESQGAVIFEQFLTELFREAYAKPFYNFEKKNSTWLHIENSSPIILFFHYYDNLILDNFDKISQWKDAFGTKEKLMEIALGKVISRYGPQNPSVPTYGQSRQIYFHSLFFKELLPPKVLSLLGFSYGPVPFEGSRSTVSQGQKFNGPAGEETFGVSFRMVTDMMKDEVDTVIPGGPSGDRLGAYNLYTTDLEKFLSYQYKTIHLSKPKPQ